jgi:hypothetical protein
MPIANDWYSPSVAASSTLEIKFPSWVVSQTHLTSAFRIRKLFIRHPCVWKMQIGCIHTHITDLQLQRERAKLPSCIRQRRRQEGKKQPRVSHGVCFIMGGGTLLLSKLLTEMSVVLFTLFTVCVPLIKRKSRFLPSHSARARCFKNSSAAVICYYLPSMSDFHLRAEK